jgi:hypothetical protein
MTRSTIGYSRLEEGYFQGESGVSMSPVYPAK